jgi:hypothetical protein
MNKTKTIAKQQTWIGYKTTDLSWTIGLTTAIIIAPAILAHTPANQIVTGTIVNALLFMAAYRLPLFNAFLIAILPSSIALLRGLLPAPMVLLIPYIILSNTVLVSVFSFMKKTPKLGVLTASLLKFGFLYSITLVLAQQLNNPLITMFQWPQLITALLGGIGFLSLKKVSKIS